jgi:hypothetical protein
MQAPAYVGCAKFRLLDDAFREDQDLEGGAVLQAEIEPGQGTHSPVQGDLVRTMFATFIHSPMQAPVGLGPKAWESLVIPPASAGVCARQCGACG